MKVEERIILMTTRRFMSHPTHRGSRVKRKNPPTRLIQLSVGSEGNLVVSGSSHTFLVRLTVKEQCDSF